MWLVGGTCGEWSRIEQGAKACRVRGEGVVLFGMLSSSGIGGIAGRVRTVEVVRLSCGG